MLKNLRHLLVFLVFLSAPLVGKDVLVEFKAAAFIPTDSCTRAMYGKAAGLFGTEVTFQLCPDNNWYGFASIDFLSKKGCSLGLAMPTKMQLVPLGFGAKYLMPRCWGDLYVGLGFQPVHVTTINCSPDVAQTTAQWGFGGIAKIGAYYNLSCNWFLDFFVDYSFATVRCVPCCTQEPAVIPVKANIGGAMLGIGAGYRFN